jgi:hypothetical protein
LQNKGIELEQHIALSRQTIDKLETKYLELIYEPVR